MGSVFGVVGADGGRLDLHAGEALLLHLRDEVDVYALRKDIGRPAVHHGAVVQLVQYSGHGAHIRALQLQLKALPHFFQQFLGGGKGGALGPVGGGVIDPLHLYRQPPQAGEAGGGHAAAHGAAAKVPALFHHNDLFICGLGDPRSGNQPCTAAAQNNNVAVKVNGIVGLRGDRCFFHGRNAHGGSVFGCVVGHGGQILFLHMCASVHFFSILSLEQTIDQCQTGMEVLHKRYTMSRCPLPPEYGKINPRRISKDQKEDAYGTQSAALFCGSGAL